MDPSKVRAASLAAVRQLGFPAPPEHFPVCDTEPLRAGKDVVDRALALHVCINLFFGMPPEFGTGWLREHRLADALTAGERGLFDDPPEVGPPLMLERQWTLAYLLGFVDALDHRKSCGDELASFFPDLESGEGPERFRQRAKLRGYADCYAARDLAFCLTWGLRQADLQRRPPPGSVQPAIVWERRATLEWAFGHDWDDPPVDT